MNNKICIFSFIFTFCLSFFLIAQDNPKLDVKDLTDKQLETLDKDVSLDDFQKLELYDIYMESNKKIKSAIDKGTDATELRFMIENNDREIDSKLKEILLPEQFEKYIKIKRERAINGEKDKTTKKKKKKNDYHN
ncbi:hypothetical protein [Apibacter adventoris]|uniref:hypothetical protein n=1 Tax=Apibacter adventoris TaxID=1679466 RepID=UPI000CF67F6F|nr:hypothetical protein [Apibacter adventoris]PQL93316.1 hypothetical protein C4S76_09630 [Apibacter adventoris]